MTKNKTIFKCMECGHEFARKQMGKCAKCGAFQQFEEMSVSDAPANAPSQAGLKSSSAVKPVKKASTINSLNAKPVARLATGIGEFDRVLGGGFVAGEVVMLAASPGAGKALKDDTLIPLADGGFKTMLEINVGDELIDIEGQKTTVLVKFNPIVEKAYRLKFSDGTFVNACEDHLWSFYDLEERRRASKNMRIVSPYLKEGESAEGLLNSLTLLTINSYVTMDEITKAFRDNKNSLVISNIEQSISTIAKNNNFIKSSKVYDVEIISYIIKRIQKEINGLEYNTKVKTTKDLFNEGIYYGYGNDNNRKKWGVPINKVDTYSEKDLPIDSYTLGLWLGDGNSADARLGAHVDDMKEYAKLSELINFDNYQKIRDNYGNITLRFEDKNKVKVVSELRSLNLKNNKHIPEEYLYSSVEQRRELLRGLMDTDGTVDIKGRTGIGFSNKQLTEDTRILIASLGMEANIKPKQPTKDGLPFGDIHYRISFNSNFDCFKLPRKLKRLKIDLRQGDRHKLKYLTEIVEIEAKGNYQCIMVDSPSKTFLCTENFIPTHNSTLSMSISDKFAQLGKTVLYVSGEESESQIGLRAKRMGVTSSLIKIINETNIETIFGHVEEEKPDLLIIDSLQTMASSNLTGSMGSIQQSKEAASAFTLMAKRENIITILISQVTKE